LERLDAAPWAERVRAELRASGQTARRRDPSIREQLTPRSSGSSFSPAAG
jgi:hypothetical protein